MRIVFLSNTRSGRGLSRWAARVVPGAMRSAGHDVAEAAVGDPAGRLETILAGAGALVVAGGDGTVHRAARDAIAANVPIYQIPCGNENLFARQFGMGRGIDALLGALERGRVARIDVARAWEENRNEADRERNAGALMLLMCSVGPDAGVIRRLTELRTRAIGHLAYVEPVVREWLSPSFPSLRVEVDGVDLVEGERGCLVIANSRQYALRIDPAPRADMTDGLLDVVFLSGATSLRMAWWLVRARLRRDLGAAGAVTARGREIRITSPQPAPYQIDGDSPGWQGKGVGDAPAPDAGPLALRIVIQPAALPVLVP